MRRREFIAGVGIAAAWPLAARAQNSTNRPLIAFVAVGARETVPLLPPFQQGLRSLGYVEGVNIDVAYRFAENHYERLPALADEVVRLKPAVILAAAAVDAVAVRRATATIPIVTPALADPINLGLVASFARPGSNVTGIMPYLEGLPAKQLELARKIVPGARTVGILGNMNDAKAPPQRRELEDAARSLEVKTIAPDIRSPDDLDSAVTSLAGKRADVVIVLQTSMMVNEREPIARLVAAKHLPTVYGYREHVDAGGLISYGVDLAWCGRRAASFVDKILRGTSPADIPVEFPTQLEMVINLNTAKALGITIPETLLATADEVIQ